MLVKGVNEISGVRVELNFTRTRKSLKCHDCPHKLHTIIGCMQIATGELLAVLSSMRIYIDKNNSIASRTRVTLA
jgi:hypothetical protein